MPNTPDPQVTVSIVIPIYNEIENLDLLDTELREVLGDAPWPIEVVYVDDCSSDGSAERLDELARTAKTIPTTVIHLTRRFGQTAAMSAGFARAGGSVVVPMDGDLQNDPRDVPRLVEALGSDFDVVSGWRKQRQDHTWRRRLPSRAASWLISRLTGVRLHDFGCTQKAYRAEMLQQLRLYGEMHRFLPAYLASLGARVTELEVHHRARRAGQSKYGFRRLFKVVLDLSLLVFMARYHSRPMHFFGQAALVFFALFGLAAGLMVIFKFGWLSALGIDYRASFVQTPLPGLAATFFLGGIGSLFAGILGELLVRVQHESGGTQPWKVRSVISSIESP
jgi:glycosyltransferase involved in cell wall biosynthesis